MIETILSEVGLTDYKIINPSEDVITAQWVRFRCMFGCASFGKCGSCPPSVPSFPECERMIHEYTKGVLLHLNTAGVDDIEALFAVFSKKLEEAERRAFLDNYYKAFLLNFEGCHRCSACSVKTGERLECVNPRMLRPSIDAMGVDVYATARKAGYEINVVKEKDDPMDRFACLLLE